MMKHDNGTIRSVAWLGLFPWLRLVRVFRLAVSVRGLVLGALAFLLMTTGWGSLWAIFSQDSRGMEWLKPAVCPWAIANAAVPDRPNLSAQCPVTQCPPGAWNLNNPMVDSWRILTLPALESATSPRLCCTEKNAGVVGLGRRDLVCLLLCGLWGAAVWALFGGAISRAAAVQLAAEEQIGSMASIRYAARKWPAYFAAPLLPIAGILLAAIPVWILGVLMKASVGVALSGLLWPLALAAGFVMTLLLLGLLFGWPLMWGAISAEGTDSFDALSRSYAYVFQRPLHYLFYAAVATVIGWLGWLLVKNFAAGVIWMSYWAASWGVGPARLSAVFQPGGDSAGLDRFGYGLMLFWNQCVKMLAVGYFFSFFWTASTAIYFQLRRDVDATETDEVFLDADADEESADLPKITTDAAGAPVIEDPKPGDAAEPKE